MWDFLDTINYNVLLKYEYDLATDRLHKTRRKPIAQVVNTNEEEERSLSERNDTFYIIWFVYYHVLECKTLSEASGLDHLSIFTDFGLMRFIDHLSTERAKLYVGYGEYKYYFTTTKDIDTILEILYNRYNYKEQLDCIARHLIEREQLFKLNPKKKCGKEINSIKLKKKTINFMIRMYEKWEKAS